MSNYWNTHPTALRFVTAVVLAAIVLVCLFATQSMIPFVLFWAVAISIGAYEWLQLMPKVRFPAVFVALPVVIGSLLLFSVFATSDATLFVWPVLWAVTTLFWVMFALRWVIRYPNNTNWYGKCLYVVGLLLLVSTAIAMIFLWTNSPWWVVYLIGIIASSDIGAYFAGRAFGKRKLAPNVSPAKSVEGLIGGIVLTAVVTLSVALGLLKLTGVPLVFFVLLSFFTGLISVLGDLFESMLKRKAEIKDSGTLLPGHGGVLDRLDSIVAATSFFALGFLFFMTLFIA